MAEPIEQTLARANAELRRLPGEVRQIATKKSLNKHAAGFLRFFTKAQLSGRKSPTSGLDRRTGDLARRGFNYVVQEEKGRMVLRVFSSIKYALLHEYGSAGLPGGVVRPKRSRYLAIPVGPALTPAGVARYQSPRQVQGLFVARGRRSGKLFMGRVEQGEVKAYFLLRDSVRVPPRLRLRERWKEKAAGIVPILKKEVDKLLSAKYPRV